MSKRTKRCDKNVGVIEIVTIFEQMIIQQKKWEGTFMSWKL